MTQDPYKRRWRCQEKMSGYLLYLQVGEYEVVEFIDRYHWEQCLFKPELLRCAIQRLQRKMTSAIFPTWHGRFKCDWEY